MAERLGEHGDRKGEFPSQTIVPAVDRKSEHALRVATGAKGRENARSLDVISGRLQ